MEYGDIFDNWVFLIDQTVDREDGLEFGPEELDKLKGKARFCFYNILSFSHEQVTFAEHIQELKINLPEEMCFRLT